MSCMTMNSHGVKARDSYHSTMALTLFTLNYTHLELMLGTSKLPGGVGTNTSSNPKNKMFKSLTKLFAIFTCILFREVFAVLTSIIIPYYVMFNHNCTKWFASFRSFFKFVSFLYDLPHTTSPCFIHC